MCIIAVVNNAVSNSEHGITIFVIEVTLGNAVVTGAAMHKFTLNFALAGDQSNNVPHNSISLAINKSNT